MKILLILNVPPYGTMCCYKRPQTRHRTDKNRSGHPSHRVLYGRCGRCRSAPGRAAGYYNLERVLAGKGEVLRCGTCMDARGMSEAEVEPGARRSTMDELAAATIASDRVVVF